MSLTQTSSEQKLEEKKSREWDEEEEEDQEKLAQLQAQEEKHEQSPLLKVAELTFLITRDDAVVTPTERQPLIEQLMEQVNSDSMVDYYQYLLTTYPQHFPQCDEPLISEMQSKNASELKSLTEAIETAKNVAGDSEVREAMLNKANFYARIGNKDQALKEYEETFTKTIGSSSRIDVVLAILRLALTFNDTELFHRELLRARQLVENGGDWERKNLLNVYEAVHLIIKRKFREASSLLIESVPTFTAYELFPYHRLVFYACVLSITSTDRVTFKKKILSSPEILSAIDTVPNLRELVFSFYRCQYRQFFQSLSAIAPYLQRDVFLSTHLSYYLRELRIVAYSQFLESYRTATLESMAQSFGVDRAFLESELFRFISSGRVNAKIDEVNGVIETNRSEEKQAQFTRMITQGDVLLNRIQNLTRIINS